MFRYTCDCDAGLKLQIYVEQDKYIPGIADGAGIRLVIHNQTDMPLPNEQGINIQPGTKTSIGLTKVKDNHKPHYSLTLFVKNTSGIVGLCSGK